MRKRSKTTLIIAACSILLFTVAATKNRFIAEREYPFAMKSPSELKAFFKDKKISVETTEVEFDGKRFYFIAANPYTGADSMDLYAYKQENDYWMIHNILFLRNCGMCELKFSTNGEMLSVLHEGEPVLHIPKGKPEQKKE